MKTNIESLLESNNINVSNSEAEELKVYWSALRKQRSEVDETMLVDEEIPIRFNPIPDDEQSW